MIAHDTHAAEISPADDASSATRIGLEITLQGRVQGVGVRPAIARLANSLGLAGAVMNNRWGVCVQVEGLARAVNSFACALRDQLPAEANLKSLQTVHTPASGRRGFEVLADDASGPIATQVAPDRVVCRDCLDEIHDPNNRRYRYPFTSCTVCGPRYSLIESLPYERSNTSMRVFAMCDDCVREHDDPYDRRGHSQINACPKCGPKVWWSSANGAARIEGEAAIECVCQSLAEGKMIAVRGVGGYQLLTDATNSAAIARLRARKHRPAKPFAVLVESTAAAQALAQLNDLEQAALVNVSNPIVVLSAREGSCLATNISPSLNTVGLMLPSSPLHDLVVRGVGRPLVCTSGNLDGEPLEHEVLAAEGRLSGVCDGWLHHNREIVHPVDDSVVCVIAGRTVTIRLARGLAPLPLRVDSTTPTIAAGGHQKCAAAWTNGAQATLGAHVGDQDTLAARRRYTEHVESSDALYRFIPEMIVHDAHPEYATTLWAQSKPAAQMPIGHHHAHVTAAMLEHGWLDREVLGVAWDGSGLGPDGSLWGGEFLRATAASYERVAHLRPFVLPGGETAIREPWRTAMAVASQVDAKDQLKSLGLFSLDSTMTRNVERMIDLPNLSPTTTSAGRLFDAAAAIILSAVEARYEGELAMRLESVADRDAAGEYDIPLLRSEVTQLDWRPMFEKLIADRIDGIRPGVLAMRFHRSLARAIHAVCRDFSAMPVVVTGGVFQNRLLTEMLVELWGDSPQLLGLPGVIPPNDGGLAAGQLAIACCSRNPNA